jgi:hypothetical protein
MLTFPEGFLLMAMRSIGFGAIANRHRILQYW